MGREQAHDVEVGVLGGYHQGRRPGIGVRPIGTSPLPLIGPPARIAGSSLSSRVRVRAVRQKRLRHLQLGRPLQAFEHQPVGVLVLAVAVHAVPPVAHYPMQRGKARPRVRIRAPLKQKVGKRRVPSD